MNLIQAMRAFVEIVERGTLARAAHAMKVSSPAISMTISNLESHLGGTRAVCAASPDYLARRGVPARPADLMKHQCIHYIDPVSGRRWEWIFEQDGEMITIEPPGQLGFSDGRMALEAALDGMGVI